METVATNGRQHFAALLKWHRKHIGLYARIANKHSVAASYVSLIARGLRRNQAIEAALVKELEKIREEIR